MSRNLLCPSPKRYNIRSTTRMCLTQPVEEILEMITLKARSVGNSTGFTLPREAAERLKIKNGDSIYLTESPDGYRLTTYNPKFASQMERAESVMRRYKDALRQLAR